MLPSSGQPRRIVVVSDFCDGDRSLEDQPSAEYYAKLWRDGRRGPVPHTSRSDPSPVLGGYLERLPLAAVRAGLADVAEIWNFWASDEPPPYAEDGGLVRRSFRADPLLRPFSSSDMLGHIAAFGPPDILCVWGLGVDEAVLRACAGSVKVYNSIDAPALRIPPEVSRHFDIVLTGADWQSSEVDARHPGMITAVLPIGPEFASPETFFPLPVVKTYDVVYVAAAQAYKRHHFLFEALAKLPRSIRALCVCGYGEMGQSLRDRVRELGIAVDFVGPPGVSHDDVNRLMNQARIGVACGVDDGAPAILTEYMLAGLPVLANAALRCGLHFITPSTGMVATEDHFHEAMLQLLANRATFRPRETVLQNWIWPRSIEKFAALVETARARKRTESEGCSSDQSREP